MRKSYVMIGLVVALLLSSAVAAGAGQRGPKLSPGAKQIIEHVDMGYLQEIVDHLVSIGSHELGFRVAGTPQDLETATYLAGKMAEIGLEDVGLEGVPVDAWEFRDAWVKFGEETFPAASMGGIPGTGDPMTAEVVYVGKGLTPDYVGVDAVDKIALAYWSPDDVWVDMIAHEAQLHGAIGVLLFNPVGGTYGQAPRALQSFDATYTPGLPPLLTIAKEDAQVMIDHMQSGSVTVTMYSDIDLYPSTGWNTIGYIPGAVHPEELIIFSSHHDAWFQGAIDDTSGTAAIVTLAKAIIESGYEPDRTLVFTTHTAEEYGYTDSYYEWAIGAYHQIVFEHPEWQHSAVALLNFEGMGAVGPMDINVAQELRGFLMKQLGRSRQLLPYGWMIADAYSWTDLWPFVAAGVPGMTLSTGDAWYTNNIYHTQWDTVDYIDWEYFEDTMTFYARLFVDLDRAPIEAYEFEARAAQLLDRLDPMAMEALGVDPAPVMEAADSFYAIAMEYDELEKRGLPPERVEAVQALAREAARVLESEFTALSVWDATIYPHEQVEMDALHLAKAIESLEAGDPFDAMRELEWWVSVNWYAPRVSYEAFVRELARHAPDFYRLFWGGQGHLAPYLDLWHVYHSIREKALSHVDDFGPEIAALQAEYDAAVVLYAERLSGMEDVLRDVTLILEEAVALLKG